MKQINQLKQFEILEVNSIYVNVYLKNQYLVHEYSLQI